MSKRQPICLLSKKMKVNLKILNYLIYMKYKLVNNNNKKLLTRKDGILGIAARNPKPNPLRANVSKPSVPASKIVLRLGAGCAGLGSSLVTLEDFKYFKKCQ